MAPRDPSGGHGVARRLMNGENSSLRTLAAAADLLVHLLEGGRERRRLHKEAPHSPRSLETDRHRCGKVRVCDGNSPMHVLIVDDEALIRWSMSDTLAQAGYEVSEASNAKETLQRLSSGPVPGVILLDYRLPDSADLKLLEAIRQMVPESRVVMMTAYGTAAMQAGAMELGAYRVVSKPVKMRALVPLVQQAHESQPQ